MTEKEKTIITLAKTLENISKILANVADSQNSVVKETNAKQLELLRYQCETSNKLISEMWEEIKASKE